MKKYILPVIVAVGALATPALADDTKTLDRVSSELAMCQEHYEDNHTKRLSCMDQAGGLVGVVTWYEDYASQVMKGLNSSYARLTKSQGVDACRSEKANNLSFIDILQTAGEQQERRLEMWRPGLRNFEPYRIEKGNLHAQMRTMRDKFVSYNCR